MTAHADTPSTWAPTLTPADIHRRRDPKIRGTWSHAQVLGIHPSGHRIRFTLPMVSDYPEHLAFTAEVFDTETLAWNPLWTIPGAAYRFGSRREDRTAETDPNTTVLARSHDNHIPDHQARSWQKIINALAVKVDQILPAAPPTSAQPTHD
ncbi:MULTISPECIES: hypothetical protein [Nocardia]|uniref:hypothetical protein n=1 Tax=Nocardia TaxID=1817 RepID=UPI002457D81F|nr:MULTISPECIES: hypothetical protein [Nocardia]